MRCRSFFAPEGRKQRCLEWIYSKVLGMNAIEDSVRLDCAKFGGVLACLERLVGVAKAKGDLLSKFCSSCHCVVGDCDCMVCKGASRYTNPLAEICKPVEDWVGVVDKKIARMGKMLVGDVAVD